MVYDPCATGCSAAPPSPRPCDRTHGPPRAPPDFTAPRRGRGVNRWGPGAELPYCALVTTQVIVLNGGSSSGKSTIARCLQAVLPEPWLTFGIDDFVDSLPPALQESDTGIEVTADGGVSVGADFRRLEAAWTAGLAATARAGARVIVDDVFLGGPRSQERWRGALAGLDVLWVGVRCEAAVAAGREIARGDRAQGMAEKQAETVHRGVLYDIEVDTTRAGSRDCARAIAGAVVSGSP